jgi:hypothetical protein
MPRRVIDSVCLLVEFWKADECCDLEDGANMHFLVCVEGKKSQVFRGRGEFHKGYFSFVLSYFVSLDDGFFVPFIA